jgi:hypothetical protein
MIRREFPLDKTIYAMGDADKRFTLPFLRFEFNALAKPAHLSPSAEEHLDEMCQRM